MHLEMPRVITHREERINLSDLKLEIAKQLGPDRTQMYFGCLTRLLCQKVTKTEFNKFCFLVLGRENIPLHNKLIRSILKNAYEAKTPPPVSEKKDDLNHTNCFAKESLHGNDDLSQLPTTTPPLPFQCNGDKLPLLPHKKRIPKSPLGLDGKVDVNAQHSTVPSDKINIKENGLLSPCDLKRTREHYQSELGDQPAKVPRVEKNLSFRHQIFLHKIGLVEPNARKDVEKLKESNNLNPTSRPLRLVESIVRKVEEKLKESNDLHPNRRPLRLIKVTARKEEGFDAIARKDEEKLNESNDLNPTTSYLQLVDATAAKDEEKLKQSNDLNPTTSPLQLVEAIATKDEEKLKESNDLNPTRRPLQPPLGVAFRPIRPSVSGTKKSSLSASSSRSNYDNGELCHTEGLRKLMEKVAKAQGMGVTLDCANLLNNALDTYLKRLIKSTVEVARVSSAHEPTKIPILKQQAYERPLNGIWAGNHRHLHNSVGSLNVNNGLRNQYMIDLRDFQVAMELHPQQLGQNWPLLLEKICSRSYEE